ncbi:uncharacterized protein LOC123302882 [Chrysoperla carnea]|uniref:uncharacterized protein LOC123302882 n=1 Tax=Chrysoperla carnea TaxID=189513 RepID=UPI001D0826AA|nr:uncharacterized protein LOC123302882 [Chrysoperla carnea]
MAEILEVTNVSEYDNAITGLEYHNHQAYNSSKFESSDESRICIQSQDLYTLPSESVLNIEGQVTDDDATNAASFISNAISFMFHGIRYEIGGKVIDVINNVGIVSTIKNYLYLNENQSKALENAGFGENFKKDAAGYFNVRIPLKMYMGFFEDYPKILVNMKQEIVIVRANDDINCFTSTVATSKPKIKINKLEWCVPYVKVSDKMRVKLYNLVHQNDDLRLWFRSMECLLIPELPLTDRHVWSVKTSVECLNYAVICFQTNRDRNILKDSSQFDHCNITNLKVYLNGEAYPYVNLNLNNTNNQTALLYEMYCNFQKSYYRRSITEPLLNKETFINKSPLFGIDCSKHPESLKSTTVDLRVEFEAGVNFPAKKRSYCIVFHDRLFKYNPLTNIVNRVV